MIAKKNGESIAKLLIFKLIFKHSFNDNYYHFHCLQPGRQGVRPRQTGPFARRKPRRHSHSMVAGGLLEMS